METIIPEAQPNKCAVCDRSIAPKGRMICVGRKGDRLYFCSAKCFERYGKAPEIYSLDDEDVIE